MRFSSLRQKDVEYNGSEMGTPNLDELAATGIRLGRFSVTWRLNYSLPVPPS